MLSQGRTLLGVATVCLYSQASVGACGSGWRDGTAHERHRMIEVIPFLDIRGGQVVDTRFGSRGRALPLDTSLAPSSAPTEVVEGMLRVFPFRRLYLTDLDAVAGRPAQIYTVASLETRFPEVEFWVDNGVGDDVGVCSWLEHRQGLLVLGSDAQKDASLLARYRDTDRIVLSLDYRAEAGVGAAEIFELPALWPERVIVSTVARAGSGAGPDLARLRAVKASAGARSIYAAGCVRDANDLIVLEEAGLTGALVAAGLYDGRIRTEHLEGFAFGASDDVVQRAETAV